MCRHITPLQQQDTNKNTENQREDLLLRLPKGQQKPFKKLETQKFPMGREWGLMGPFHFLVAGGLPLKTRKVRYSGAREKTRTKQVIELNWVS